MNTWFHQQKFTPSEALDFLNEARALAPLIYSDSNTGFIHEVTERLRDRFLNIHTHEDWLNYLHDWPLVAMGPTHDKRTLLSCLQHSPSFLWRKSTLEQRLGINSKPKHDVIPATWQDVGRTWKEHQLNWLGHGQKPEPEQMKQAIAMVQGLVQEHEWRHLRIPLWHLHSENIQRWVKKIHHLGEILKQSMNLSTGPGLGGKVGIEWGFTDHVQGSCRFLGHGSSIINVYSASWKPLGHEWFHAWDMVHGAGMGRGMWTEQQIQPTQTHPFKTFIQTVRQGVYSENDWEEAKLTRLTRWSQMFPSQLQELKRLINPEMSSSMSTKDFWKQEIIHWASMMGGQRLDLWRACALIAEAKILLTPEPVSLWRAMAQETQYWVKHFPELDDLIDYLDQPSEIMAHWFESRLHLMDPLWTPSEPSCRYPFEDELQSMESLWHQFMSMSQISTPQAPRILHPKP